jgi:hypothetical protein
MDQPTSLSPEAQDIRNQALNAYQSRATTEIDLIVAATLRAAADSIVPEDYASFTGHVEWDNGLEARNDSVRESLLGIAAELESRFESSFQDSRVPEIR